MKGDIIEKNDEGNDEEWSVREEIHGLMSNSCPVVISGTISMFFSVVCLITVGHVSEIELAAAGFGTMFCNMTGYSIVIGIASGLETVASQLYGAGKHRVLGVALQRTLFVTSLFAIPVSVVWLSAGAFLHVFVDPEVSKISGAFVGTLVLGLPFIIITECVKRYLNAQGHFSPVMYSTCAALILYAPLCWYAVDSLGLGSFGASLSLATANALNAMFLVIYVRWRSLHAGTWTGWSREALTGVREYLRVALPSCGMVCLEWWCFEIVTLASGRLGTTVVAAQSVMFNTNAIVYMVGLGFAVAVAVRTGNLLGAGRPALARKAARLAWAVSCAAAAVIVVNLYLWRREWAGETPARVQEAG